MGFSPLGGLSGVGYSPAAPAPGMLRGEQGGRAVPSCLRDSPVEKACLKPEGTAPSCASILQTIQAQHRWDQSCPTPHQQLGEREVPAGAAAPEEQEHFWGGLGVLFLQ